MYYYVFWAGGLCLQNKIDLTYKLVIIVYPTSISELLYIFLCVGKGSS